MYLSHKIISSVDFALEGGPYVSILLTCLTGVPMTKDDLTISDKVVDDMEVESKEGYGQLFGWRKYR